MEPMFDRDREAQGAATCVRLPVTALDAAGRGACLDALSGPEVRAARSVALVIDGATLGAISDPFAAPSLATLCLAVEALEKPVIAALSGPVTGHAAALAVAAHYRLAGADVSLGAEAGAGTGVVPAGGFAVRAVRLAGIPVAVDVCSGTVPLDAALTSRLIDKSTTGSPAEAADRLAEAILSRGLAPRRASEEERGLTNAARHFSRLQEMRADRPELTEVLEAAVLLPFDAALDLSETLAEDTRRSPAAQAALHLARARAACPAGNAPEKVVCLGTTAAALDLTRMALSSGASVSLVASDEDAADVAADTLVAELGDKVIERLSSGTDLGVLEDADLTLVSLPMELALQQAVTKRGPSVQPAALVTDLPVGASREVLRLFPKVALVQISGSGLAEISAFDDGALLASAALVRQSGGVPLLRRAGLQLGDRLLARQRWAAQALLEIGASAEAIDAAMEEAGYARPVFRTLDEEGLDAPLTLLREQLGPGRDDPGAALPSILRSAGRAGRAAGQGYYHYEDDVPVPDPAMDHVLGQLRMKRGQSPRAIEADEICAALHAALVNAALDLVAAGETPEAADLAAVLVAGFPEETGGPLRAADDIGLIRLRKSVATLAERSPRLWAAHPRWVENIKFGRRFCQTL